VPSVSFHAALGLDAAAFADVQARARTRVLSTFVRRGLIDNDDVTEMRAWAHDGGFSVDGSVRIEGAHRTGLERAVAVLCPSTFRAGASAPARYRSPGLPQSVCIDGENPFSAVPGIRFPPASAIKSRLG
jgi:hypothetical protein